MNQSDKAQMLRYIQELGFAIDDVVLYLDTHPTDEDALRYYEKYKKMDGTVLCRSDGGISSGGLRQRRRRRR